MLSDQLEKSCVKGSLEEFCDRRGFISFKFKSVLDPVFKFIKVPEFDMPHRFYVNKLNDLNRQEDEEYK